MLNKKGSAWSTVFWVFIIILITSVAIRHSMTNNLMYANLTANNYADEELRKQQYSSELEEVQQQAADKENLKRLQKQQEEDYKESLEKERQKQYEEEQQKEALEEELRQQQKQEQENYYKQQMAKEQQEAYEQEQQRDAYQQSTTQVPKIQQSTTQKIRITVTRVFDGDTIQLSTGETVRLIGINAPESGYMCSAEATSKLRELTLGKEITLEKDIEESDQYGRLLRYVYVNQIHVNIEMTQLGLAHKYRYGQNTKYSAQFEEAENRAKQNQGCIWKTASVNYIQDKCLAITYFHYDAAGNDNYNLNDEYVTFKNSCNYPLAMTNWTVKDNSASHAYQIPNFTANAGASFTLYTGTGTNTDTKLYWQRTSGEYQAVWNNSGDTLYLTDEKGNLIITINTSQNTIQANNTTSVNAVSDINIMTVDGIPDTLLDVNGVNSAATGLQVDVNTLLGSGSDANIGNDLLIHNLDSNSFLG